MASANALQGVKIFDISLIDSKLHVAKSPRFHIKIEYGRTSQVTEKKHLKGNSVNWSESFHIFDDDADELTVNFHIVKTKSIGTSSTVGSCKHKIVDLLELQVDSGYCKLDIANARYRITLSIEKIPDAIRGVIDETSGMLASVPKSLIPEGSDTWSLFLSHFQTFMTAMNSIAGVNNYVKLAWSVLSVIPTIYLQTRGRSDNIQQLCEKLKDTYEYATDAERLQFLKTKQSKVLDVLAKQTSECAFCIQDYIKANIAKKLWKGTSMDDKIKAFNDKFDHLISVMNNSVVLETGIVTLRASETSDELKDLFLLDKMPYASYAGFFPGKKCLPGTRQSMVDAILQWVNSDSPQRILLLTGQTGTGKSAVAHTIAEIFQEQNRLGAMFCFNQSYKDDCGLFFSTISRNLADGDSLWRKSLVEVIRNTEVRMTTDPTKQFNELIVKPAKEATTIGPVVIVIDALNESGVRTERQVILDLLFGRCEEFPDNYRIIVTSCPEQDIELLCENPAVLCKRMSEIPVNETVSDIQSYISSRLKPISRILDRIDENWSNVLTKRAECLFQWAETACRFINPTTRHPPLIEKRWKTCISDSGPTLYDLYQQIILTISNQPELEDTQFMHDFKLIVGALMMARGPLSMQALENLFQDVVPYARTVLSPFGSLFLGIGDDNTKPIRPLHSSLFDFFQHKDPTNPNLYHIDTSDQNSFALGCLKLLNRMLRFNICGLETSHIKNRCVPDLKSRIDKAIPSHLSYACRFWAFHLKPSGISDNILDEVRFLMHVKLLYLFEALSLLRSVDKGIKSMKILVAWCKDMDNELAEKAEDAWRFGYDFGDVMTVSTPHLYLSALPFAPSNSFVFKQFSPLYPHLLRMEVGQSLAPASKTEHLKRHNDAKPFKITFSSYGPYIATGFDNGELWVWNYETEEMIYSYKPKRSFVLSDVVFSTDGESVYSSSKNGVIRISNFMVDSTSHNPYKGDFKGQSRFCTISPNGRFIASNSKSKLRLYDIHAKADLILDVQQTVQNDGSFDPSLTAIGVTVQKDSCSIFSPNGNFLAFIRVDRAENNSAICIWDIRAKEYIATWVQPPKRRVRINALSDNWIAFTTGSSLKICDVPTKTEVHRLKIDASIRGITFFPNNEYFLCHVDKTCSIWSIRTGELVVANSIEDHIETATISCDSKLIALGIRDGTICIQRWDDRKTEANNSDNTTLGRGFSAVVLALWLLDRYLVQVLESGKDRYLQISDITTTNDIVLKLKIGQKSHVSVPLTSQNAYVGYTLYHQLFLWDERGECILEESKHNISALAFSPAGDYLISGDSNGDIKLWNVSERHLVHEIRTVSKWIPALAFSANGSRFLAAYHAAKQTFIEVREFPSRIILKVPLGSILPPLKVVFSANETRIACITKSGIAILNAFNGEPGIFLGFKDLDKAKPQFSPDNKYVALIRYNHASGIRRLELWDINHEIMIPDGPWLSYDIDTFKFSNDSTSIITASHSPHTTKRHINIWDIKTGKERFRSIAHFITWGRPPLMALNGRHLVLAHNAFGTIWNLDIMSRPYERGSQTALLPFDQPEQETGQEYSGALDHNGDLKYAKLAWNKALFTEFAVITQGGWILGPNGEYLFWVPPGRRRGLWRPCVIHMAAEHITRLNFDKFVHGTRWTGCKD